MSIGEIILIVSMGGVVILTAIAAVKVKNMQVAKALHIQQKQRVYRKFIYRYTDYKKRKAKSKRILPRGRVKAPAIH